MTASELDREPRSPEQLTFECINKFVHDPDVHFEELQDSLLRAACEYAELRNAIARGGWDISPCMDCGESVVCLPDGMPCCEDCSKKAMAES